MWRCRQSWQSNSKLGQSSEVLFIDFGRGATRFGHKPGDSYVLCQTFFIPRVLYHASCPAGSFAGRSRLFALIRRPSRKSWRIGSGVWGRGARGGKKEIGFGPQRTGRCARFPSYGFKCPQQGARQSHLRVIVVAGYLLGAPGISGKSDVTGHGPGLVLEEGQG